MAPYRWIEALLLVAQPLAAQTLQVPNQTGILDTPGQTFVVQFAPGADSGTFDFTLSASPAGRVTLTGVAGSIPNGLSTCSVTASTVTCLVSATSPANDLGAGSISVTYTAGGNAGPITLSFSSAEFFDQNGNPEPGSATGGTLDLPRVAQATLTASASPATIAFGATSTLSTAGGSGTGSVSWAVTSGAAICSVSGTTLTANGTGSCTVTATKAGDANYLAASASTAVSVVSAAQAPLTVAAAPASIILGDSSALSTGGGSGTGAVSFLVTAGASVCSISGSTLTGTGVGQCTVTASKAADANYLVATATTTVTVANVPTAQTLFVPDQVGQLHAAGQTVLVQYAPGSDSGGFDFVLGASPTGRVSFTAATGSIPNGNTSCSTSANSVSCSVSASSPGINLGAGSLSLTFTGGPTAGALNLAFSSANFRTQSGATSPGTTTGGTLTLNRAEQSPLSLAATPSSIVFGASSALSTSGGSGGGGVSYAVTSGAGVCSLGGTTLTATAVGSCTVTATKAGDPDFNPATASATITVAKAPQAPLAANAVPSTLFFGGNSTLSTSGGSGSGGVSYAVSSGAGVCSLAGSTLTGIGVGQCLVTATRAADANYLAASASVTVTVNSLPAAQALSAPSVQGVLGGPNQSFVVQYTPGADSGAFDFALSASPSNLLTFTAVTPSIPNGSTSCSVAAASVTCVATANTPTGDLGAGTITVTYSAGTTAGTAALNFTNASFFNQLGGVEGGTTTPGSIVLPKLAQNALGAVASPSSVVFGGSASLATTGGSGTGAVSWALTSGIGVCAVSGTTLTAVGVGSCSATATKASDATYLPATASVSVSVARAPQAALIATVSPSSIPFGGTSTLSVSGGSGSGAVSWSVVSGTDRCSITGNTLFATAVGTCTVQASKAGDALYLAATAQANVSVSNTLPTLDAPASAGTLEDLASAPLAITVGDAETSPAALSLSASSSNPALVSDSALAAGFGGSGGNRSLVINPTTDVSGSATITLSVTDGDAGVRSRAIAFSVTAVNDAPDFVVPAVLTLPPGASGPQLRSGFASAIVLGPPDEQATQAVQGFVVSEVDDPMAVVSGAQIAADGALSFTLSGTPGIARLRVLMTDTGGTANGGVATSAAREFDLVVPLATNLSVALDDGVPHVLPGAPLRYQMLVANAGPSAANGTRLMFPLPQGLAGAVWTCQSIALATCPSSGGAGGIDQSFDLPVGGSLRYVLDATVVGALGATLNATATLLVPVGLVDLDTLDNTAVDNTPIVPEVILGTGFEPASGIALTPFD